VPPNFLSSSRRPGGEDNILARLARDGQAAPTFSARIVLCILASVLIIGLIVALVSLTRENLAVHHQPLRIEATAAPYEPAVPVARADAMEKSGFAALPSASASAKMAAAIMDLTTPREMVSADRSAQLPPLVMLHAPAAEPEPDKPNAAPTKPLPAPARPVALMPARKAPSKLVTQGAVAKRAQSVRGATARPLVSVKSGRARKLAPAAAPLAEPTAVDSDVALLSAVIMQASRHASERAQPAPAPCRAGKKCALSAPKLAR
jgi:hypothetical protein